MRIVPDHSSSKAWAADGLIKLSATGGRGKFIGESFNEQEAHVAICADDGEARTRRKRRRRSKNEEEDPEKWSRDEFMASTRSASQQASIEFGVQMAWGLKFAAGRVHSMIRCSEQIHATCSELANEFLAVTADNQDAEPAQLLTETGRACCSHPGCSKQAQAKGNVSLTAGSENARIRIAQRYLAGVVAAPLMVEEILAPWRIATSWCDLTANARSTEEAAARRTARCQVVRSGIKPEACAPLTEVLLCARRKVVARKLSLKGCVEPTEVAHYAKLKAARKSVVFKAIAIDMVLSTEWSSVRVRARSRGVRNTG